MVLHLLSDLEGLAVSSQASAAAAITKIDDAFADLADKRADLGAYMNRLGHALGNAETFAATICLIQTVELLTQIMPKK